MIQRYTWLSLLNDVAKKTQPEAVTYRKMVFKWNGHSYVNDNDKDLTSYMSSYSADTLCAVTHLSAEKEIITDAERAFLKVALAPIRGRNESITKKLSTGGLYFLLIRYKELPEYGEEFAELESWCFRKDEQFTGMKLGFEYTPEDIDL